MIATLYKKSFTCMGVIYTVWIHGENNSWVLIRVNWELKKIAATHDFKSDNIDTAKEVADDILEKDGCLPVDDWVEETIEN